MRSLYLRLSVTEGCNLRCRYCRPRGQTAAAAVGMLPTECLVDLVQHIDRVVPLRKVRLTGGEPLCRPDLPHLALRLRQQIPAAKLGLTTNGTLLAERVDGLVQAGISLLNISVDTIRPRRFAELTRGGQLQRVLEGIEAARRCRSSLRRLKLNAVLQRSVNGDEGSLAALVRLAGRSSVDEVRFIELMPIGVAESIFEREQLPAAEALERLSGDVEYLGPLPRRGTARRHRFRLDGLDRDREIVVGLITPVSEPFCSDCDRLRLDSTGRLYSCLRSDRGVDLGRLAVGRQWREVQRRVQAVIDAKWCPVTTRWPKRAMVAIGG